MKVASLMIPDPITITEGASISEAIVIMKESSIRHLPVVTKGNRLTGFVTLADMKQGLIPSMVSDVSLADLMIKDPIVIGPDDDIEIAARIIYQHKIGGMPVVKNNKLVGIITETDILRAFIDMMGLLTARSRIDLVIEDKPGLFRQVLQIISDNGGDIINVGMPSQPKSERVYYFRLAPCNIKVIKKALEQEGFKVVAALDS
ncbi:CBS and ACT domain-containing protein [Thermodesulfobacteriota bacterium]